MIWNPWRRIRQLEEQAAIAEAEIVFLDQALQRSHDRYDRIRETNLQLRDCLALYRTEGSA